MLDLTPAQRRELRADAHHLRPTVSIAANGLTAAVLEEIDRSLQAHELIKIKVHGAERENREAFMSAICEKLQAAPVQHIGNILVVWRQRRDEETHPAAAREDKTPARKGVAKAKSARAFAAAARVATIRQNAADKKRRSGAPPRSGVKKPAARGRK